MLLNENAFQLTFELTNKNVILFMFFVLTISLFFFL
jgi:hypothetical protein